MPGNVVDSSETPFLSMFSSRCRIKKALFLFFFYISGAYGTVYRAKNKVNGHIVAMKKIRVHLCEDGGLPPSTLREIAMLKQVDQYEHPNIVR